MSTFVSFILALAIGIASGTALYLLTRRFTKKRFVTATAFIAGLVFTDALIGRLVFPVACDSQRGVQVFEKARASSFLVRNSSSSESIGDTSFSSYLRQHGPFEYLEIEFGSRDRWSIVQKPGTYRFEIKNTNDPACSLFRAADLLTRTAIARAVQLRSDECLAITSIAQPKSRYAVELVDAPLVLRSLGINYSYALRISDLDANRVIGRSVNYLIYRGGWLEREVLRNPDGGGMFWDTHKACPVPPQNSVRDVIKEVFLSDHQAAPAK